MTTTDPKRRRTLPNGKEKPKPITADDLYRHSSQYRMWSFTEEQLKERRTKINIQGKRKALKKLKHLCDQESNDYNFETSKNFLELVEENEELKEINYYVDGLSQLCTAVLKFPSQVKATAIMFLKRFYLVHSVMEYDPKKILSTCIFLAAKSENYFMSAKDLAGFIGSKTTAKSILDLEFELINSLSFTLLCHHPYRSLHGFFFDFQSILIHKHPNGVVVTRKDEKTGEMKKLKIKITNDRIMKAYIAARDFAHIGIVSDAPFSYTPPQIALTCLLKVDEELTIAYLTYKFVKNDEKKDKKVEVAEEKEEEKGEKIKKEEVDVEMKTEDSEKKFEENKDDKAQKLQFYKKLIKTLRSCSKVIENVEKPSLEEAKTIARKLHYCINPDKLLKRKRQESQDAGGDQKRFKLEE